MRRGFATLADQAEQTPTQNPFTGHMFVFRGRRGDLIKIIPLAHHFCAMHCRAEGRMVTEHVCSACGWRRASSCGLPRKTERSL